MKKILLRVWKKIKHAMPDKLHIRLMYFSVRHQILHLRNPKTYPHKVQWLKLYGNLEQFTDYADKYEVRKYIEAINCQDHLIPMIGVWDAFDEVPFDKFPDKFVIKATHGSGYNVIVTDKKTMNVDEMREKFNKWMGENYYNVSREPQYRLCKPRIIAEEYIDGDDGDLKDFKFYCFNGKPEIIVIASNRKTSLTIDVVDLKWNRFPATIGTYPNSKTLPDRPVQLDDMLKLAKKLSADFPFVRVDLYESHNKVYFGELTFTPGSGLEKFGPEDFNDWCGSMIDLSAYKKASA
jgi:hypothetical protein